MENISLFSTILVINIPLFTFIATKTWCDLIKSPQILSYGFTFVQENKKFLHQFIRP